MITCSATHERRHKPRRDFKLYELINSSLDSCELAFGSSGLLELHVPRFNWGIFGG